MRKLKPISTMRLPASTEERSTEPKSVGTLRPLPLATISAQASPQKQSTLRSLPSSTLRTLDFDIETVAAGFADPQWVPNRTTCWAYAWADEKTVRCEALPVSDFYNPVKRRLFIQPLLDAIAEADVLTGHNILRFDLPIVNAECLLLGLPTLKPMLVQDTIRLPKSKGFKKGQDNMGHALGIKEKKLPLSWAEWEAAYGETDLGTVKERCSTDVLGHLALREAMLERGILGPPRMWRP